MHLTRRTAAAAGFAVILALATPALANAQGSFGAHQARHVGADNLRGGTAASRTVGRTGHAGPLVTNAFPSASSTVIGSVGFIDSEQVGYFWSAARGDSVEQTFSGPPVVRKAVLKLDVMFNGLSSGAKVSWVATINGKTMGHFTVQEGVQGPLTKHFSFTQKTGGTYDIKIAVTNEVPGGDGSITLRYAGSGPHSIVLRRS